nr:hypothetical protein BaRGS_022305 [Batillaria attramentaria]
MMSVSPTLCLLLLLHVVGSALAQRVLVCYFGTWSQDRGGYAKFLPTNIDPFLCTHVIVSFAEINLNTTNIQAIGDNDTGETRVGQYEYYWVTEHPGTSWCWICEKKNEGWTTEYLDDAQVPIAYSTTSLDHTASHRNNNNDEDYNHPFIDNNNNHHSHTIIDNSHCHSIDNYSHSHSISDSNNHSHPIIDNSNNHSHPTIDKNNHSHPIINNNNHSHPIINNNNNHSHPIINNNNHSHPIIDYNNHYINIDDDDISHPNFISYNNNCHKHTIDNDHCFFNFYHNNYVNAVHYYSKSGDSTTRSTCLHRRPGNYGTCGAGHVIIHVI